MINPFVLAAVLVVALVVLWSWSRPQSGDRLPRRRIKTWKPVRTYDDFTSAAYDSSFRGNHAPAPFGQHGSEVGYVLTDEFKALIPGLPPEEKVVVLEALKYTSYRFDMAGLTPKDVPGIKYGAVSWDEAANWIADWSARNPNGITSDGEQE